MKSIEVKYFAILREQAGLEKENMQVDLSSYSELYLYLGKKYNFGLPVSMIQVAVNDEFVSMQTTITCGAKVVFIPPVAGG